MNREEIARQIAKFKSRRLKARLAHYSLLTSLLLALSIFGSGITSSSLISFLLVLPIPLYFARETLKFARKSRAIKEKLASLQSHIQDLPTRFSFLKFISQPGLSFRFSLLLFLLIIFTTFARTRVDDSTLSMNPSSITINR